MCRLWALLWAALVGRRLRLRWLRWAWLRLDWRRGLSRFQLYDRGLGVRGARFGPGRGALRNSKFFGHGGRPIRWLARLSGRGLARRGLARSVARGILGDSRF